MLVGFTVCCMSGTCQEGFISGRLKHRIEVSEVVKVMVERGS